MGTIRDNLETVRRRMTEAASRAGKDPDSIRLVTVSKTFPAERVVEAFSAGALIFGENRVQEALDKIPLVEEQIASAGSGLAGPCWHLIGHLQRNKARHVIGRFDLIHSVDNLPLIQELEKRAAAQDAQVNLLLEVNVSGEEVKNGCRPEETEGLAGAVKDCPHLNLEGLMTMPPLAETPEDSRCWFRDLRELRDRLAEAGHENLRELSMGMTADFEVAIEEGATLVRVGTAVFGPRD
jgi:pyridoxal phosphate enzyme (YggS family)